MDGRFSNKEFLLFHVLTENFKPWHRQLAASLRQQTSEILHSGESNESRSLKVDLHSTITTSPTWILALKFTKLN